MDDDIRWFVALLSDTGMRLVEAAGLAISDLHLDAEIPFVRLSEHRWKRLNTKKEAEEKHTACWCLSVGRKSRC